MAGLLYKDFIALKGKIYVAGALLLLLLITLLRLFAKIEGLDMLLFSFLFAVTMLSFLFLLVKLEISLIAVDDGKGQKRYFLSTPVTVKEYVASKYVFLLLAFYAVLMMGCLTGSVCLIGCREQEVEECLSGFLSLLPGIACMMLLVAALELPFFLGFGVKHGTRFKTGLLLVLFFGGMTYLLFGDLTILERFSVLRILKYMETHQELFLCLEVFLPYLALGLYYLSYRIACVLSERKEREDD